MAKLSFGKLIRTTMSELPNIQECIGIYIVAYMGKIVYVGKAEYNIPSRLVGHFTNALNEPFGAWLRMIEPDWQNVRLDVLTLPDEVGDWWLREAENTLIRKFNPLFNEQL